MENFDWGIIYTLETVDEKAENFQTIVQKKLNEYLPQKDIKFCNDDQPFFT